MTSCVTLGKSHSQSAYQLSFKNKHVKPGPNLLPSCLSHGLALVTAVEPLQKHKGPRGTLARVLLRILTNIWGQQLLGLLTPCSGPTQPRGQIRGPSAHLQCALHTLMEPPRAMSHIRPLLHTAGPGLPSQHEREGQPAQGTGTDVSPSENDSTDLKDH